MPKEGLLFVLSGPSGVGKGTVCKALLEEMQDMKLSVSHTTRSPRQGEVEGVSYCFVSEREFKENIDKNAYLEWAKIFDNYYGTPMAYVEKNKNEGVDTLLEIDTQGAIQVKERYPQGIFIFVLPPSVTDLRSRLEGRKTESSEKVQQRLKEFETEINRSSMYDYLVVNDDIAVAKEDLKAIIRGEHLKFENSSGFVELLSKEIEEC